jgi:hypothetical protein
MGQQLQARQFPSWRSGDGEQLWMLIEAMEEVSRPELRSRPCDPFLLAAVSAQLAGPACTHGVVSPFSLRN